MAAASSGLSALVRILEKRVDTLQACQQKLTITMEEQQQQQLVQQQQQSQQTSLLEKLANHLMPDGAAPSTPPAPDNATACTPPKLSRTQKKKLALKKKKDATSFQESEGEPSMPRISQPSTSAASDIPTEPRRPRISQPMSKPEPLVPRISQPSAEASEPSMERSQPSPAPDEDAEFLAMIQDFDDLERRDKQTALFNDLTDVVSSESFIPNIITILRGLDGVEQDPQEEPQIQHIDEAVNVPAQEQRQMPITQEVQKIVRFASDVAAGTQDPPDQEQDTHEERLIYENNRVMANLVVNESEVKRLSTSAIQQYIMLRKCRPQQASQKAASFRTALERAKSENKVTMVAALEAVISWIDRESDM